MTPPQRIPADLVAMRDGCKAEFMRRHKRHKQLADDVWKSLVGKRNHLQADTAFGPLFSPPTMPAFLADVWPLRVIKGLPHAFRAIYTIVHDPADGVVVRIEWVGSHAEYDDLFGYTAS